MPPLAHDITGHGPAVLLIHGFPLCRRMWQPQHEALTHAGFQLICPDLPGFGDSPAIGETCSMSDYADQIIALLDHCGIEQAVIGGMSMGGYVLFDLIERYPQRLAGALFIVTRAGNDDAVGREKREQLAQVTLTQGTSSAAQTFSGLVFAPATSAAHPELIQQVTGWMKASDPRGLAGALRAMRDRTDQTASLGKIRIPTLSIGAEQDRAIPFEHARAIADGISGAQFCLIPAAGHMVNLEQPERFNACVIDFLDSLPRW